MHASLELQRQGAMEIGEGPIHHDIAVAGDTFSGPP